MVMRRRVAFMMRRGRRRTSMMRRRWVALRMRRRRVMTVAAPVRRGTTVPTMRTARTHPRRTTPSTETFFVRALAVVVGGLAEEGVAGALVLKVCDEVPEGRRLIYVPNRRHVDDGRWEGMYEMMDLPGGMRICLNRHGSL